MAGSSLWDFDEPSDVGSAWDQPASQGGTQQIDEDEDGNAKVRKRSRVGGRPSRQAKKGRSAEVVELLDDDDEGVGPSPLCSPIGKPLAPRSTRPLDCSPVMLQRLHASTSGAAVLDPETRRKMEHAKQLQLKVQEVELEDGLDDDEDLEVLELPSCRRPHATPAARARAAAAAAAEAEALAELEESLRGQASATAGDAGTAGVEAAGAGAGADDGTKLTLTCKCKQGSVEIRVRQSDPFSKLQKAFLMLATDKGWLSKPPASIKFEFDGDALELDSTPADLELEDGYTIDVTWKA